LIYGTNLEKPPAPILVKKLLLMLIAAGILKCQHLSVSANADGALDEYNLALGLATIGPDGTSPRIVFLLLLVEFRLKVSGIEAFPETGLLL
jgi:hypothetical protein